MAVIVANCPRCKSNNMTFDVMSQVETGNDALDLQDFCVALLERIFTEPKRLQLAAERRAQRRGKT